MTSQVTTWPLGSARLLRAVQLPNDKPRRAACLLRGEGTQSGSAAKGVGYIVLFKNP